MRMTERVITSTKGAEVRAGGAAEAGRIGLAALLGLVCWASAPGATAQQVVDVPPSPELLEVEPVEVFAVGQLEGPAHAVFADVTEVAFGPDGSLHVLDRWNFRVVVFGPDGAFRHELGGEGGGPGEFRLPSGLAVDAEGRVWVGDALGGSLKVFGPDGGLIEVIPLASVGRPDIGTMTASDGGSVLFMDRTSNAEDDMVRLFRASLGGAVETVGRVPIPFTPRMEQSGSSFRRIGSPTFTAPTRVKALPGGGYALVHGTAYEVTATGPDGPLFTARAPLDPAPVTEAQQEEAKERVRQQNRELAENPPPAFGGFRVSASTDDALEETLARMRFTEEHGVIREVDADPEGRLWVQRWAGSPWGPAPIDLISARGAYLGSLPAREMPDAVGPDGRMAYVEEDDLGVQRVRVMRVRLPG